MIGRVPAARGRDRLLVLLPGWLVARALGQRGAAATFVWALRVPVRRLGGRLRRARRRSGSRSACSPRSAVVAARRRRWRPRSRARRVPRARRARRRARRSASCLGLAALARRGRRSPATALFHEARVRKLVELGDLHLRTVDEFADGGLHPATRSRSGTASSRSSRRSPGSTRRSSMSHEASLLVPLACLRRVGGGRRRLRLARRRVARARGVSSALYCFAAGHGGVVRLARAARRPRRGSCSCRRRSRSSSLVDARRAGRPRGALAAAFGALALVHPTYALFALIPLAATPSCAVAEWRASGARARRGGRARRRSSLLWLRPLVNETARHDPTPTRAGARARALRATSSSIWSVDRFRARRRALVGRTRRGRGRGARARAARGRSPARRRWGAFVLGGTVAVLALMLVPELFTRFSDAVSLSQSRRAAGFVPFAFAFAGGLALARAARLARCRSRSSPGSCSQHWWPGDFELRPARTAGPGS